MCDAVAASSEDDRLGVVPLRSGTAARRFAAARCIGDWIAQPAGEYAALLTGASTFRQQRSRAFAAEFLAPAAAIRARLVAGDVDSEDLAAVAVDLHVSEWVVRHQVDNQMPDMAPWAPMR
jgi:hypothetical protein